MLSVVAGGVAAYCLYHQMDEEIRCRVEAKLAQHYKNLRVKVRSAQLVEGKGVRVRDLSIVDPNATGPAAELLHVEEALLDCSTDWKELLQGDPPVRRVTLRRATLRVARLPGGGWGAAQLLPPPSFGDHPPEVVWENGVTEIIDSSKRPTGTLVLRDINVNMATPQTGASPSRISGIRRLHGTLIGDGFRRIAIEGQCDVRTSAFSMRGKAEGLEISPELRDSLPAPLSTKLAALGELRGQAEGEFQINYDPARTPSLRFDVSGRLARGRIDNPRLPRGLTEIRAGVHIDNGGWSIENLSARSGQTQVRMSCKQSGFAQGSPLRLSAEVRRLDLDRALLDILPQSLQDQWYKFLPSGQIDLNAKLEFDGSTWQPEISAQCLNVSFTHHKFPYRLNNGRGTVALKNDALTINLMAYSGNQPVRVAAGVAHPFAGATGWFEAKGDDLQIDEALVAALPEKTREVVRSLDARGSINFYVRMWRDRAEEPMHQHILLGLKHCSVRYNKFPYPLSNISGMLENFDQEWTFRDIDGSNGTARVTCEGRFARGLDGNELVLNFVAHDVPLEETLRDSLSPNLQQTWYSLRPRGVVDLTAETRYRPEEQRFSVGVRIEPQRETASVEPVHFPYRLERLQGVVQYRDGHVELQRCRAEHGAVRIATDGDCDIQPDGRGTMRLTNLVVDRLRADRDLLQALPERLRKAVVALNPTGPMNLRGSLEISRVDPPGQPLHSKWDVHLGLQQSNVRCGGLALENVCGEVALLGVFDGQHVQSRGEFAFDSLTYKDCQLTQVMGPIWIDDGRVLFGSWVDRRENGNAPSGTIGQTRPPRPLTAKLFGGTLFADGWVTLGVDPRYAVNATLTDADLGRCAQEATSGRQKLSGKVLATADLTGAGRTRNALAGRGGIRVSNADVYELPVMISLLKILSIRPPDQNAFSDAMIEYRIEGEHIYFDRIDFHGDAISLRGKGEMDFQSSISLKFYAMVGRGELDIPVVKQVFRGASQQLMLIHVGGTVLNPETSREALPALNQALQQIRDDLQNRR